MILPSLSFTFAVLVSGVFAAEQAGTAESAKHRGNGVDTWGHWGRDLQNTRHNPDSSITAANVKDLALNWQVNLPGDVVANPALEDGYLYVTDTEGNVFKMRECDGSIFWQQNLRTLLVLPPLNFGNTDWSFSRNTPIVTKDSVVVGLRGPAVMVSLCKKTGALQWQSTLSNHPAAVITQSGTYEDGVIYIGVSSLEELFAIFPNYPCCSFVGSMHAVCAKTGKILWTTYMMPTELVGIGKFAGCSVWGSAPAVDDKNVYIGTGNLYSLPAEVAACQEACDDDPESCIGKPPCVPESVHFDSVVALNKKTGKISWATRLEATDAWNVGCIIPGLPNCPLPTGPDYDFGQAPIIFGKDGLVAGQKSGAVWGINRKTGKVRWSLLTGPGGTEGGHEWGSTLVESTCGGNPLFVNVDANSEHRNFTLANGQVWNGNIISAVDAVTGELVWQTPFDKRGRAVGALTSTEDVVFSPVNLANTMWAFSAKTGLPLWSYTTNSTVVCGATIGKKAIYFGNGYFATFGGKPGRTLFSFGLPDC